jgi:hypothetical protein
MRYIVSELPLTATHSDGGQVKTDLMKGDMLRCVYPATGGDLKFVVDATYKKNMRYKEIRTVVKIQIGNAS